LEDKVKLNQLFPTVGTDDGGRTLLRFTPVVECSERCIIYENCSYLKKGRCSLEQIYLNQVWRTIVNPDPKKGISDQLNDFELMQIDLLISLYHQKVQFEKLRYSLEHNYETTDKKGGKKMHPVYAAISSVTKDIVTLMKALDFNKKWERKFGTVKGVGGAQSIEEMLEKGDASYYDEISK